MLGREAELGLGGRKQMMRGSYRRQSEAVLKVQRKSTLNIVRMKRTRNSVYMMAVRKYLNMLTVRSFSLVHVKIEISRTTFWFIHVYPVRQ
jgi:hypothetical protein